jgi:cephalosporin hydroxylase
MLKKTADAFHVEYEKNRLWEKTSWLGVPTWKLPFDAWILQELIYNLQPDYIIETGTAYCGSALFYASIMKLIGHGKVITVDKEPKDCFYHPPASDIIKSEIIQLTGDSIDPKIVKAIHDIAHGKKNIVILDSWHSKDHVLNELNAYKDLVPAESYIIVEDTHVNGHPVDWTWGEGPYEAVQEFLKSNPAFVVDDRCEKLHLTFNPSGFLRRKWA